NKLSNDCEKNIRVYADKNMTETVIRNLLVNANKFTSEGNITINANIRGNTVEISIKDTGVGIDEEKRSKIFQIDKNVSTEGTNGETGTGLGLILCKEFIEKNSGKIRFSSERGKGSTFTFTLPAYNGDF
ncbi:MAG TPA: HAMP domain-containing sensor histidine kinase, partial [Spirochaetota bacterium]|nr:HAMP domain-containing sensor histidine kinase [Spirochaetota bacterium]